MSPHHHSFLCIDQYSGELMFLAQGHILVPLVETDAEIVESYALSLGYRSTTVYEV